LSYELIVMKHPSSSHFGRASQVRKADRQLATPLKT